MTSETRFEELLTALGVIAKLTENKRLSKRKGYVDIEADSKFQFAYRWWYKDNRKACLEEIKKIANEAIGLAKEAIKNDIHYNRQQQQQQPSTLRHQTDHSTASLYSAMPFLEREHNMRRFGRLSEALELAAYGIETMKVTYKNDDLFCSKIDVLLGNIREQIGDMDMALQLQNQWQQQSQPHVAQDQQHQQIAASPPPLPPFPSVTVAATPSSTQASSPASSSSSDSESEEFGDIFDE